MVVLNNMASQLRKSSRFAMGPFRRRIAAIRKAGPADSAHDELSAKFPQNEISPGLEALCDRAGNRSQRRSFHPRNVDPAKAPEEGADRHGFPNREVIVRKPLERFLSVENLTSGPLQVVLKPPRLLHT